jgi:hypothetical protein
VTKKASTHSGDIRQLLASSSEVKPKESIQDKNVEEIIVFKGITYRKANSQKVTYTINKRMLHVPKMALIDRGANGGVFGNDVLIFGNDK